MDKLKIVNELSKDKTVFCIIGASGTGKDSLVGKTLEEFGVVEVTSTTSRPKREGEVDGVDYHFLTAEEILNTDYIEISNYAGNYYSLTAEEFINKFKTHDAVYVVVDNNGYKQIKEKLNNTVSIYVKLAEKPEDQVKIMKERMKARGDKNIQDRLNHYIDTKEYLSEHLCDYVIINDDYERAKKDVISIYKEVMK